MKRGIILLVTLCVLPKFAMAAVQTETWTWVDECKAYHAAWSGAGADEGIILHFGDSITYANQYTAWMRGGAGKTAADNTLTTWMHAGAYNGANPTDNCSDFAAIKAVWARDGTWLAKVDRAGNGSYTAQSSITAQQYAAGTYNLPTPEAMLDAYNPQMVVIMLGTNDLSSRTKAQFKADLENIIQHVIWQDGNMAGSYRGAIPILTTIPPRVGYDVGTADYKAAVVELAQAYHLPLVDLHGEIMTRAPSTWSTVYLQGDGVHLSYQGGGYDSVSDPYASGGAALNNVGYLLRSFLTFQKIGTVKAQVLDGAPGALLITTSSPLADGYVGTPYSATLQASGGTPPYTWTVDSGSLLPLSLSSAGVISGTPTIATTLSFTARVTDFVAGTTTKAFTITITSGGAPVTVDLNPIQDTCVDTDNPTTNYGTATSMNMGGDNGTANPRGFTRVSLLKFDLSGIPSSATVTSAVLKLYANNDQRGGNASIQQILSSWTETGATWTSRDGTNNWITNFSDPANWQNVTLVAIQGRTPLNYTMSGTYSSIINGCPVSEGGADVDAGYNAALDDWDTLADRWIQFDVTSLVDAWVGGVTNNGLAMCQIGRLTRNGSTWVSWGYSNVQWLTKEFVGYEPVLTVTYQGGTPDTEAPTVTIAQAVLTGTVYDAVSTPAEVVVNGTIHCTVSGGGWSTPDFNITDAATIPIVAADASGNSRTVNVVISW